VAPEDQLAYRASKGCWSSVSSDVMLDSNWRWIHDGKGKNGHDGNTWISSL
jgi:hypothetical protein